MESLARLATAVQHLAADADAQQAYLQNLGTPDSADELALEFDDLYRPLLSRIDEFDVPPLVAEKLAQLDSRLREMSGPEQFELWTPAALRTAEAWRMVRASAADVLVDLT
jgi:hypothetical protein